MELSYDNRREWIVIPVLPASIEMSEGGAGSTFNVAGLGEINVIKDRKLSEYSFSSFFPAVGSLFLTKDKDGQAYDKDASRPTFDYKPPHDCVKLIMKWMETKRPIRFKYQGATFAINSPVSIESFQWKEVAGGGGDIDYSIKLKHYVFYSAKKVTVQGGQARPDSKKRPDEREPAKTYTLQAGDSLWRVAQLRLGDGTRWKEIQTLNGIKDADLKRLPIGKVLKLP
jgi:hypothetical protein